MAQAALLVTVALALADSAADGGTGGNGGEGGEGGSVNPFA